MGFSPSAAVTAWFSKKCWLSSQTNPACLTGPYTTRVRASNASESPNVLGEDMFRRLTTTRLQGKPGIGGRCKSVHLDTTREKGRVFHAVGRGRPPVAPYLRLI